jgi:hypothetical protein
MLIEFIVRVWIILAPYPHLFSKIWYALFNNPLIMIKMCLSNLESYIIFWTTSQYFTLGANLADN